jgi:hypothetical protein
MNDNQIAALRQQLLQALKGDQSHITFRSALHDFPRALYSAKPAGSPHTAWQLLEHLRITQNDILEFSRNPKHKSPAWPAGYWPTEEAPPDEKTWQSSIKAFLKDAAAFAALIENDKEDLFAPFAHGDGQTLLREALVLAAHNSYHLGQLVYLKKGVTSAI